MVLFHVILCKESLYFLSNYLFVRLSAPPAGQQALMSIIYIYRPYIKTYINKFQQRALNILNETAELQKIK